MALQYWRTWQVVVLWVVGVIVEVFLYAMIVEDALSSLGGSARVALIVVFVALLAGLGALTWRWLRTRAPVDRRRRDRRHEAGRREDDQ